MNITNSLAQLEPQPTGHRARTGAAALAGLAALAAAGVAAIACVGPIAAALLGLGGAAGFAGATALRGPASLLSIALFALGFYLAYRRGSACGRRRGRMTRAFLWIAATLTFAVYLFEYVTLPRLS